MIHFVFLNIPVRIVPSFWLFLLFFTGLYRDLSIESCILGGVLILSLLVHEYGHALTALYFGTRPEITLEAFGGYASYNSYNITPKQRFLITLNGPLLESLLIVIPCYLLETAVFHGHHYIQYFLYATMQVNIVWCLLNLLPVIPLDGGYLSEYLLTSKFGERGHRWSLILGLICVALAAPYLFFQGFLFFGILLLIFGLRNYQMLQKQSGKANDFGTYAQGIQAAKEGDTENAKQLLRKLLKSQDAKIKTGAAESLAKLYLEQNEGQKAYDVLLKADHGLLKEGKCLLCKLAFERKNYTLVSAYAQEIYALDPSYETALLNSQAFACLRNPTWSSAWLQTAAQFDGISPDQIRKLLQHPSYDAVREDEAFKQYQ